MVSRQPTNLKQHRTSSEDAGFHRKKYMIYCPLNWRDKQNCRGVYFPGFDRRTHLGVVAWGNIFDMAEISRRSYRGEPTFVNGRSMNVAIVGTI